MAALVLRIIRSALFRRMHNTGIALDVIIGVKLSNGFMLED